MKVTLFFGFGHFLVVKMLFVLPEIGATLGIEVARDWNQMKRDQVSRAHFGHMILH